MQDRELFKELEAQREMKARVLTKTCIKLFKGVKNETNKEVKLLDGRSLFLC